MEETTYYATKNFSSVSVVYYLPALSLSLNPIPKIELWRTGRENVLDTSIHNLISPTHYHLFYYYLNHYFPDNRKVGSLSFTFQSRNRQKGAIRLTCKGTPQVRERQTDCIPLSRWHNFIYCRNFPIELSSWLLLRFQAILYARK